MSRRIPKIREDCLTGINKIRPCPWIRCSYHMLWITYFSSVQFKNETDEQVLERMASLEETCVLDVAEENGATLERIGQASGLTRERIRQIEYLALIKVKHPKRFLHIKMFKGSIINANDFFYVLPQNLIRMNRYYCSEDT